MTSPAFFFAEFVRDADGWILATSDHDASGSETAYSEGALTVFADARIDDRERLCAMLGVPGDAGAAQIILAAYQTWGDRCADRLLGDFAFVIFDHDADRIFCARDFIGARALYYHHANAVLRFSNDLAAITARLPQPCPINPQHVARKLAGNLERFLPETGFQNILRLPQSHWCRWTGDDQHLCEYWTPEQVAQTKLRDDAEIVAEGRRLIHQAICDRLQGAHRIAVHVSGGLDSSLIAAMLRTETAQRGLPDGLAFAWYGGTSADCEVEWVDSMAQALAMPVHVPHLTEASLMTLFRQDGLLMIEAGNLLYENALMEEAANENVDVIFSGWGGDQAISFNGKGHRAALLLSLRWRALARLGDGARPGFLRATRKAIKELLPVFPARDWRRKLRKSYLADPASTGPYHLPAIEFRAPGVRARMAELINAHGVTERIETWARAGRSKRLTYVYPLLDRRVVEFALSLPGSLFVRPGQRRWIFRQIAAPFLPDLVRSNDSKREPNRVAALSVKLSTVFRSLADEVRNCQKDDRTQLVDLDRLANDLRVDDDHVLERLYAKRQAVQILNLAPQDD